MPTIEADARREAYGELQTSGLYHTLPPASEKVRLRAVPYFTWGNRRAMQEMQVWVREGA